MNYFIWEVEEIAYDILNSFLSQKLFKMYTFHCIIKVISAPKFVSDQSNKEWLGAMIPPSNKVPYQVVVEVVTYASSNYL